MEGGCRVVVSLLYLLFRRALAVTALRFRSREFKEFELWCCATSSRFFAARWLGRGWMSVIGCFWRRPVGC
jgi:hypothetical protein